MPRRKQKRIGVPNGPSNIARGPAVSRFDNMTILGYTGIGVVFSVAVSVNDFRSMWDRPDAPLEIGIFVARIILFIEFTIVALRFVIATRHELEMWIRWLKNPIQNQDVYSAMFAISLILGLSMAFPYKIVSITGFITASFLFLHWAQWLANDHVKRALQETRSVKLSEAKRRALDAMEYYWLKRPQMRRLTMMTIFAATSFGLALAGWFWSVAKLQLAAYTILILDIVVGETVISGWRSRLDQEIKEATNAK